MELNGLKAAVTARFPESSGKISYVDEERGDPPTGVLVFQNIFSGFQIWQKGSKGASESFKKADNVTHRSLKAKVSEGWWGPLTLAGEVRVGGVLSPSRGR